MAEFRAGIQERGFQRWSCSCGDYGTWYPIGDRTIEAGRAVHLGQHERGAIPDRFLPAGGIDLDRYEHVTRALSIHKQEES